MRHQNCSLLSKVNYKSSNNSSSTVVLVMIIRYKSFFGAGVYDIILLLIKHPFKEPWYLIPGCHLLFHNFKSHECRILTQLTFRYIQLNNRTKTKPFYCKIIMQFYYPQIAAQVHLFNETTLPDDFVIRSVNCS